MVAPLFSPIQKTTNLILLLAVIILLILPIYTFAAYECGQGCVYQGNQVYHCEDSAGAWAGCNAYAIVAQASGKTGICMQWGVGVKYSQALYIWSYPDPPLDCGGPDACSAKAGEAKAGTFQYPSDKICNLQSGSCQVACSTSEDLGNGQIITTGCTFTGSVASAQAPAENCSLEQASGASPQDCASGKVLALSWDETYTRCTVPCSEDLTACALDNAKYFWDRCAGHLPRAAGQMVMGGMFSYSATLLATKNPAMAIAASFGGSFAGATETLSECIVDEPTPQHNCTQDFFIRTSTGCEIRNNPTLDPNIFKDPVTGQGTPCPYPLIEDKILGICTTVDYPLPTAQQMQDALEQGVTNPPRSEPCPPNTHEINGICFKDSDDTPYKDGTTLPQNEPATQGGDGYHVWVDNQIILERIVSEMRDTLNKADARGVVDSSTLTQQLEQLQGVNEGIAQIKSRQCGGAGQPTCSVEDIQANDKLQQIKTANEQVSASVNSIREFLEDAREKDCTQQPWLMSTIVGGMAGLYECNVYDEEANEKLAVMMGHLDSLRLSVNSMVEKETQAEIDAKIARAIFEDQESERKAQRQQRRAEAKAEDESVRAEVKSKANSDNATTPESYATDWSFGLGGNSITVPFSAWAVSILAVSPMPMFAILTNSCHFQYTFSATIAGSLYSVDVFPPDLCDKFAPFRAVLAWIFSVYTVGSVFRVLYDALTESQRALLASMAAEAAKRQQAALQP